MSQPNPDIEPRWRAHDLPIRTLVRMQALSGEPDEMNETWETFHLAVFEALDALDAAAVKLQNYQELARASGDRLAAQLQTEAQNADRLRVVNMRGRNACNVAIQAAKAHPDIAFRRGLLARIDPILSALDEDRT